LRVENGELRISGGRGFTHSISAVGGMDRLDDVSLAVVGRLE
jgi:hypothetical protein